MEQMFVCISSFRFLPFLFCIVIADVNARLVCLTVLYSETFTTSTPVELLCKYQR